MDIDAALKDGYSIQEVNAEAARRAGFNLAGAKADGYSDDEILQELRGRLSKPQELSAKDKTMAEIKQGMDQQRAGLTGTAETLLNVGTGAAGAALGWIPAAMQKLNGSPDSFENLYAKNMESMTFQPRTEAGQETAGRVGEFINRYVVPVAPMLGGLPMLKAGEAATATKARLSPKATEVPKPVETPKAKFDITDELAGKVETPATPTDVEFFKQQALAKQQAALEAQRAAGEQPITVDTQGRASALGAPGPLTTETPMQRMARDLGGEPFAAAEEFNPMTQMAQQLPGFEESTRNWKAQDTVEARAALAEQEARKNAALDINAERYRNRLNAPTGATEHAREVEAARAVEQAQRDSELAQRAGQGEQASVFEPHANMHRPYEEVFAQEGGQVRPLSKAEFTETLNNLAKEPGTAFVMPENITEAYKQYLEHPAHGQMDFFGANEVPVRASHKTLGQMTPAEKTKLTKSGKKLGISTNMQERMKLLAEDKETGISQLRSGFTKEDVTKAWQKVGLAFEDVKRAMNSVDIHKQDVYTEVAKDIQMYMNTGMPSLLHFAGQELKAAGYPESVTNAFKEMTKAASEYERIQKTSEMPFELRKTYNLQRQVSDTAKRLRSEAEAIYNQLGDKRYRELSRAEKKLAKEASEKEADANWIGSRTGLAPFEVFDRDWSQVDLGDVQRSAQFFDAAAEKAAKEFLSKWNDTSKTPYGNKVVKLHANFDPDSFKMAGLGAQFGKSPLLNVPGIGDKLKSLGNAMIETPEAAIDLAKAAPDVSQNMVQRGINALTKGGIFLKAKVNNPVVHFTVDRFLKADGLAKAEVFEKLHTNYLGALRELSNAERTKAFEILNTADLYQKEVTPELMQKYGLSEKLQNFITEHQKLMSDVLDKINTAREATGKKPITAREAYSAMSMTGDFRKVVYKMVDGKQEVVGVIGSDSKTLGKNSLSALEKKVLEKDASLSFGPLQDMTKTTRSAKGTPHEAFQDVLAILGEDNPHIAEFVNTLKEVAKDDPSNYLGMQKHTMQKKGVFGMEGRKFWESTEENARAFFENQLRYAESAYNWSHLAEAAKDVNEVIRNPEVVAKQDNAIRLADSYMQNALGINPSRMGKALNDFTNAAFGAVGLGPSYPRSLISGARGIANTWMLSLSPAFIGMQIVQAPAVMPAMTALLRGRGLAPKITWLTNGMEYFAQAGMTYSKAALGKELTPVERGALDYAKKNHVYATDMVEHANQIEKGVGYYATKLTQTPAAITEQATRAQVYMSFVHMLDEAGLSTKSGLYEQAQRLTDMAMVNYSAIEKPAFYNSLGPIGSMAYNLKSFGHNEETGNPAPLLTQMAVTIALAGVMGLPFFSQFEALYDFITKKLGKPRSLALDVQEMSKAVGKELGPNATFALSNGAPTLLGVDLSTRLGLGDVLPSSAADAAFAGGGKLYEMGKATGRAMLSPSEENLKAAAINLAPPVAQGPLDVAWYQKNGLAYSKDPERLRPMAKRNDADILFKKIGLTGINESSQKTANYQNAQLDKAYAEYRTTAMRTIAQDLFRNRPIDSKTLDKYFVTGQGDPATFSRDIQQLAIDMNLDPQTAITLKQAATQRIPQLRSLQRRTQ